MCQLRLDPGCLDWIEHRDIERAELRDLLLSTLIATGSPPALGDAS